MRKKDYHIDWTDFLAIPAAAILSYVLMKWLPRAIAMTLSVVAILLLFSLFEPRGISSKRFIVGILLVGLVVYILAAFFRWPY